MSNRNLFLAVPPHDLPNVANYNIFFALFPLHSDHQRTLQKRI
jgi:hypothetical protein